MSGAQELAVREKQELANKEEKTIPGRYFVPTADIFETDEALTVIMEMPGVEKKTSASRSKTIAASGRADQLLELPGDGAGLYGIQRRTLRTRVHALGQDRPRQISAQLDDGVLTLTLPKVKEAVPRRISVG